MAGLFVCYLFVCLFVVPPAEAGVCGASLWTPEGAAVSLEPDAGGTLESRPAAATSSGSASAAPPGCLAHAHTHTHTTHTHTQNMFIITNSVSHQPRRFR